MFLRLLVAILLMSGAVLAAHLIKTLMSQPEEGHKIGDVLPAAVSSDTTEVNYEQLAEKILAGGMFASWQALPQEAAGRVPGILAPAETASAPVSEPPLEAAAKIRLIGTVVGPKPMSRAVIEDVSTKKQTLYHLNEFIPEVGEIADIRPDGVLIRQGHQQELLELQTIKRVPSSGFPSNAVSSEEVGSTLN